MRARQIPITKDAAITKDHDPSARGPTLGPTLERAQRRLLRRIFNGRTVPIIADGRQFLTYKEASRYLLSLPEEAREQAYARISGSAARASRGEP